MSTAFQTYAALAIVALAASGLIWRALKRKKPGCSSGCGCPTDDFKKTLK